MPDVVKHFCGLVDGIDVASAGEMDVALAAGMRPELHQLRRPGQDAGRTRARRRRRHRDQHGIRARDAAHRRHRAAHGRAAQGRGPREPGLRAQDLGHEDGRRPEAVRRGCRTRAADARGTGHAAARVLGLPHLQRLAEPAARDPGGLAAEDGGARDRAGRGTRRRRCACSTWAADSASRTSRASSRSTSRRSARTCARWCRGSRPPCRRRRSRSNSAATSSASPACTSAASSTRKSRADTCS